MDDLKSLKAFLESKKVKVKKFTGYNITTTNGDVFTMAHGIYYKNDEPLDQKQFVKSFDKKKK